jgi:hypothetical protein
MFKEEINIDREKLYKLYMDHVDYICDECDWVSSFTPKDIINMISNILEQNPKLIKKQ